MHNTNMIIYLYLYIVVFGESDFFLNQNRTMQSSAYKNDTSLWYITREKLNELESVNSDEIQFFNKLIVRILARQVNASRRFG